MEMLGGSLPQMACISRKCTPCHHFLSSSGAFARLSPVNPSPTRTHTAKTTRKPRVRSTFALDIQELMSGPYRRLYSLKMYTRLWHGLDCVAFTSFGGHPTPRFSMFPSGTGADRPAMP